jgi:hydroxyacylglutathione hydrolase
MKIEQFEDKNLSHFSYAIRCERKQEIVLIDPARDPQPYYDLAD